MTMVMIMMEGHSVENWYCRRCQFCHVCGLQTGLLQCDRCLVRGDGDDDDNGRTKRGELVLLSLLVLSRLWSSGRSAAV